MPPVCTHLTCCSALCMCALHSLALQLGHSTDAASVDCVRSTLSALLTVLRIETEAEVVREACTSVSVLLIDSASARAFALEVGAKASVEVLLSSNDKETAQYAYCAIQMLTN
jgi:hypothetical protein